MVFFGQHGYRVIAHDRHGHGRSSQSWDGNEMNTYGDDVAELFEKLDLKSAILIGHSTGGNEDLKKIDIPRLVLHGDDDQIVPIGAAGLMTAKIVKNATLKVIPATRTECVKSTPTRSMPISSPSCSPDSRLRELGRNQSEK